MKTDGPSDWLPAALVAKIPGAHDAVNEAKGKTKRLAVLRSNHARLTNAIGKDVDDAPRLLDPSTVSADDYVNPTGV